MPRTILHVADILTWADEHFARTGKYPICKEGDVYGQPLEKWRNIDHCLREGRRGLPGKWSLPQLLTEYRGYRNHLRLPKYTIKQILEWADAHHKRTGRWPNYKSGPIPDAPGESWQAVQVALFNGARGLPGGSTLAEVLHLHRRVRNQKRLPRLTVKLLLQWVDAHRKRTGKWPTHQSGPILESPGDKWHSIDTALRQKLRGVRQTSSLAQFLLRYRGIRPHVRRPGLSIKQILEWADAHKRRTGRWPTEESGPIPDSGGETWLGIQAALHAGYRGLKPSTLPQLLAKRRGVRNSRALPAYTEQQIVKWIQAHYRRNGKLPTCESGTILGSSKESWMKVNSALTHGLRGLPSGSSLSKFIAKQRDKLGC
jgi:hypothetical protein